MLTTLIDGFCHLAIGQLTNWPLLMEMIFLGYKERRRSPVETGTLRIWGTPWVSAQIGSLSVRPLGVWTVSSYRAAPFLCGYWN